MVIDFHTHCFPDTLAPRAMEKLSSAAGYAPETDGTVSGLLDSMKKSGIDRSVVCNIATNAKQQTNVNNFAIELHNTRPDLIPLGSVNPDSEPDVIESELKRVKTACIKGIKIHPDYMKYTIDSPVFEPIFECCSDLGLFVVTHTGYDVISPDMYHATPKMLRKVTEKYKDLKLVAAHFGANRLWDEILSELPKDDIYIDTSLAVTFGIPKATAEKIILSHNPDKILFGSDLPWDSQAKCREFIESLNIGDGLKEKIFSANALNLIK